MMVESQLVTSMPSGDPILIGKPYPIIRPVCMMTIDLPGSSFMKRRHHSSYAVHALCM